MCAFALFEFWKCVHFHLSVNYSSPLCPMELYFHLPSLSFYLRQFKFQINPYLMWLLKLHFISIFSVHVSFFEWFSNHNLKVWSSLSTYTELHCMAWSLWSLIFEIYNKSLIDRWQNDSSFQQNTMKYLFLYHIFLMLSHFSHVSHPEWHLMSTCSIFVNVGQQMISTLFLAF